MKVFAKALSVVLALCFIAGPLPARAAEWMDSDGMEPALQVEDAASEEPAESLPDQELPEGLPDEEQSPEDVSDAEPPEAVPELYAATVDSGKCGKNLTWVLDKNGTLTISGTGEMEDYPKWNDRGDSIKKVVIAKGVTSIGEQAFYNFSELTSVTIPIGVTSIKSCAFFSCSCLTSLTIPASVRSIGSYAFFYCGALTSMTIPAGVTSIESGTFDGCSDLSCVTIPMGVTSIKGSAFMDCISLASAAIPESVTFIGDSAFSGCSSLTSVTIPKDVTSIKNQAFSGCSSLTSVAIPMGVTSIEDSAFMDCSSLTSMTIPESVTSIEDSAFSGCSGLTSAIIPESVTSIGDSAFEWCSPDLCISCYSGSYAQTYAIENNLQYKLLDPNSGSCGLHLTWVLDKNGILTVSGTGEMQARPTWRGKKDSIKTVIIEAGVKSIGNSAFSGCRKLTNVIIPASVTSIGTAAFANCGSDLSIHCYPGSYAQTYAGANRIDHVPFDAGVNETAVWHTVANGVLTYSVLNAPKQRNVKLIAAGYANQRMRTVRVMEGPSGTLELDNLSAGSCVLFLVETGTMKPLCPKAIVSAGT